MSQMISLRCREVETAQIGATALTGDALARIQPKYLSTGDSVGRLLRLYCPHGSQTRHHWYVDASFEEKIEIYTVNVKIAQILFK
jgi:hypothetical protein